MSLPRDAPKVGRDMRKRLLTASEAAEYLGLAEQTLRGWANMRKVPSVKLGRALRFDVWELEEWIDSNRQPVRNPRQKTVNIPLRQRKGV